MPAASGKPDHERINLVLAERDGPRCSRGSRSATTPRSTTARRCSEPSWTPTGCTRIIAAWREESWRNAEQLRHARAAGGVDGPLYQAKLAAIEAAAKAGADAILATTLTDPARNAARNAYCQAHYLDAMAFTRQQIRDPIERAGDEHWQALIRHHEDAYPESRPTPGDVARAEAERLNGLGLGDDANLDLVESRVERVSPAVRITHVFEDRDKGTRFETDPFTGYE